MKFAQSLKNELGQLRAEERFRQLRTVAPDGKYAWYEGRRLLNLSGNDYLGLAAENACLDDFILNLPKHGCAMTSSSSRLLTGSSPAHAELEELLMELYGRPALVFNSGYHANTGILPALSGRGDLILCDKLNHASIIDGIRLSGADFKRYPHLDFECLEKLLKENCAKYKNIFIITESIFSMDGDAVDIAALVELKKQYDAVLIVDEAHSVGVVGRQGLGACEAAGAINDVDIIIGTFGKALASVGAYVITSKIIRDYLINRMRTLIFTTALPPACVLWSVRMLKQAVAMSSQREHLHDISNHLRERLLELNINTKGCSHIVPAIVGKDDVAVNIATKMRNAGFLVFPIRPPTVPPETARLRFSLNAALEWDEIKILPELL